MRISFKEAANAQQAANIARDDNLIYIPAPFIKAIRQRNPGADIRFIRQEFARRLETYQAARGEEKFSDEDLLKAYEDPTKMFDFSYDTDRIKKGRRYTP